MASSATTSAAFSSSSSVSFPTSLGLAILLAASLFAIFFTMLGMYVLLVQMELQRTLSFADAEEDDVKLEETTEDDVDGEPTQPTEWKKPSDNKSNTKQNQDAPSKRQGSDSTPDCDSTSVARRLYLPRHRRGTLAVIVGTITFMSYLLLARSNAHVVLNWIGMAIAIFLLLRTTLAEEVVHERWERLATLASMLFMLAMAINLAVYANQQHAQGDIYQGKARILSYDTSLYTGSAKQQSSSSAVLRTDLEVGWGGRWGCPNQPEIFCETDVAGALCETTPTDEEVEEVVDEIDDNGNNRWRRRRMRQKPPQLLDISSSRRVVASQNDGEQNESNEESKNENDSNEDEEEVNDELEEDAEEVEEVMEEEVEQVEEELGDEEEDPKEKNQELKDKNDELKKKNEELEEEKEELDQELEEYENDVEYEDEEEDEILEDFYSFDDDMYYDEYWSQTSWGDVWGDYSCGELFDSDLSGRSFDNEEPPGTDDWPFVNIYGNCNTCEAYIIDYFSTQHFLSILGYKSAALNYGILAGVSLCVTVYLLIRELYNPRPAHGGDRRSRDGSGDKEIELLPTAINGGALA